MPPEVRLSLSTIGYPPGERQESASVGLANYGSIAAQGECVTDVTRIGMQWPLGVSTFAISRRQSSM